MDFALIKYYACFTFLMTPKIRIRIHITKKIDYYIVFDIFHCIVYPITFLDLITTFNACIRRGIMPFERGKKKKITQEIFESFSRAVNIIFVPNKISITYIYAERKIGQTSRLRFEETIIIFQKY